MDEPIVAGNAVTLGLSLLFKHRALHKTVTDITRISLVSAPKKKSARAVKITCCMTAREELLKIRVISGMSLCREHSVKRQGNYAGEITTRSIIQCLEKS